MPKNRNVHSLCIVLQSSSLSSPAESSSNLGLPPSPLRSSDLDSGKNSQFASGFADSVAQSRPSGQALAAVTTTQLNESSQALESKQKSSCLLSRTVAAYSSKTSIFKEGVITPITPNFSPTTRVSQGQHLQPTTSQSHGTKEAFVSMQSGNDTFSKTGCTNTPNTSDGSPSWQCIDEKLAPHQTQSTGRYVSLSNLPTDRKSVV